MTTETFSEKWAQIKNKSSQDETSLFVEPGNKPITQRQLNLYYYFLFIKNVLEKIGAKKVLETGCGRGTMSLYLAKYLGLEVSLLDNSADAIEVARAEFAKHGLSAQFFAADALGTNLPAEQFDAIVSIGLAEHIDEVEKLFVEQFHLLKKGGAMISLNIPKKFSIQYLNNILRVFKKILGQYKESIKKDYYRNSLKPADYFSIAKKVGFADIKIVHVCPFPVFAPLEMPWDKRAAKVYKMILAIKKIFQKYPYKTNPLLAQAHFLVGYKK